MKFLLIILSFLLYFSSEAQVDIEEADSQQVFLVVEKVPLFPGGESALIQFISDNLIYPTQAMADSVAGLVVISFVVDTLGKIQDAEVTKSVRQDIDIEALRVVNNMPEWAPGEQKGKKVNVRLNLPIRFALTKTR